MFAKPLRPIALLLFTAAFAAAMFGIVVGLEIYREYSMAGGLIGTLIPAIVVTAIVPAVLVPIGRWMWQFEFAREHSAILLDLHNLDQPQGASSSSNSKRGQTNQAAARRFISLLRWVAAAYFFLAAISAGLYDFVYIMSIKQISLHSLVCTIYFVILAILMAVYAKSGADLIKTASASRPS